MPPPPPEDWANLVISSHRTRYSSRSSNFRRAAFNEAFIAAKNLRGEDISELIAEERRLVCMYRAVEAWGQMDVALFEDCLRLLVYSGRVGCPVTLRSYSVDVLDLILPRAKT